MPSKPSSQFANVNPNVFLSTVIIIAIFLAIVVIAPSSFEILTQQLKQWITDSFSWFYVLSVAVFLIMLIYIACSASGKIKLCPDHSQPEYSNGSWFAMLFTAGMGIGLMFYGVSEPLSHYSSSVGGTDWAPLGGAAGDPEAAAKLGMAATIFHWGLHPWGIYAIIALGLAIFSFNKGLPLTIRSIFYPLLGERVWGWPGHIIDILAILATLFGLATSLGFGASQAAAGLNFLFDFPANDTSKVLLIIGITAVARMSVVAGLEAGVKRLSEINMMLAAMLLLFVIIAGPTLAIATGFVANLGAYLQHLPALANPLGREDINFSQGWTAFYWAWWISWSPFVGMFIARVSRGRTVREFLISVLLIPSLACVLWMTVFGGTAISQVVTQGYEAAANAELPLQLFAMLDALPLAQISSFIGIILVVVFFVTSSDSGSLVIDTIAAGGKVNAPTPQRVFWCVFEGLVAIALIVGGGLVALQAMAVSTGLPFTLVLLAACVAVVKGLMSEPRA